MIRLYHQPLCPFSRKIRLVLRERNLVAELIEVAPWDRDPDFLKLNPAAEVPVLVDGETVVADSAAIVDYLQERHGEVDLLGQSQVVRNEVRRLVGWFDVKFRREVTDLLWGEKLLKRLKRNGVPSSEALRAGAANIRGHLAYIGYLYEDRRWLAGDDLSLADLAAAAHLSVLDYLGDVPWEASAGARDWYAKVKSRPSFRPLLMDRLTGLKPPMHYDDLDF
jgi:glutathione S-transferase